MTFLFAGDYHPPSVFAFAVELRCELQYLLT